VTTSFYPYEDEFDRLKRENDEKKKKLESRFGEKFCFPGANPEIDPLIENQFLKNIEAFENTFQSGKSVKIFDFIGKPKFKKVSEIPDSRISIELEKALNLLNDYQIELSTLCIVSERELYRFITEELIEEEINDIKVEDMVSCFIYEEFHPNCDYDIRNICSDFIISFMNHETKFFKYTLTKEACKDKTLNNFINSFRTFELIENKIEEVCINGDLASLVLNIAFKGTIEGSTEIQSYSGPIFFTLVHEYGYWSINKVNISKLVLLR
jgi:hypothetical protein